MVWLILKACIKIEDAWTPVLQREDDKVNMEAFSKIPRQLGINKNQIVIANDVRI